MVVLTALGRAAVMSAAFRGLPFQTFFGLFQNAWTPTRNSVIGDVVPCDFSGYSGLINVTGWGAPIAVGEAEVCSFPPIFWTRGVGTKSNWVVGYYVVDGPGNLLWGESNPNGSYGMTNVGNVYQVTPQIGGWSRY
jgi:hypothetical protein